MVAHLPEPDSQDVMPRLVDHPSRRREITAAACRLIAERGIEATTLRDVAGELGLANGAIAHYFATKDDLLASAFQHVYAETDARVDERLGDAVGLAALRVFCREVLPLEELQVTEARVVLPFWGRMASEERLARIHSEGMAAWRDKVVGWLGEARRLGDVDVETPDSDLADELMGYLMGAQVLVLAQPCVLDPARQQRALDAFMRRLLSRRFR